MEFGTAPFILRSLIKDEEVAEEYIATPSTALVTATLGARVTNKYDKYIEAVSKFSYLFFSLLAGQTLGEELCDLLAVSTGSSTIAPLGITRKTLLALFFGAQTPMLSLAARKLFPLHPAEEVIKVVDRVLLCLLMLFETYGTIRHRLLRVKMLSLRSPEALRKGAGPPHKYLFPGLITTFALLVQLLRVVRAWRGTSKSAENGLSIQNTLPSEDDDDEAVEDPCTLCFSRKKNPTCTPCGHVFCWQCITESTQRDSRCPLCRESVFLPSLVPLFFYQPHKKE